MRLFAAALLLGSLLASVPARAHQDDLASLAWQPRPGAQLPLAMRFRDEHGEAVRLGRYFAGTPVVLLLEYLRCKELCAVTLANIVGALQALPLEPGRDFRLLVVSIDPRDQPADAAAAKRRTLASYHHPGADRGVHVLTGTQAAVEPVADAIGFRYRWDPDGQEYVHPAGFVVAAPTGVVSRYFLGVAVRPADLRSSIAAAAQDQAAGPLGRVLLLCHIEGTTAGRFEVPILAAFTLADIAGGVCLILLFAAILRRRHG